MTRTTAIRTNRARMLALGLVTAAAALTGSATDASAATYCKGQVATIVGTSNPDRLTGTSAKDVIYAGAGNDLIDARDGNDVVCGADGDDRVLGGVGNDTLDGGAGNDACSTSTADTRSNCEPGMATSFMPTRHGFPFTNHFTAIPTMNTIFGTVGLDYGLCGGMAFAAKDTWAVDDVAPGSTTVPVNGSTTFNYLWTRLLDSLTIDASSNLIRFYDLQHKTDAELTVQNLLETNAIKTALASGPVPVGVIIPSATGPIWGNHQVLAIGWFTRNGSTVLKLYDPNVPDAITYLDVNAKTLGSQAIRGLFMERHDVKTAPWS